tara:strand:- start:3718 stop:4245 length:528 start_codon:yes stop_codon:yes gene_type:complete
MKRPYESGMNDTAIFFTGIEIEKTPAHNMQTLFVVGMQSAEVIVSKTLDSHYPCKHIYLGANHSFKQYDPHQLPAMVMLIDSLLAKGYWVTIDIDTTTYAVLVTEYKLTMHHDKLIPLISVPVPEMTCNKNTCIKIDDVDFDTTNDAIYVHKIKDLRTSETKTEWEQYGKDAILS